MYKKKKKQEKNFEKNLLSNIATPDLHFQRDTLLDSRKKEWKLCRCDTHCSHYYLMWISASLNLLILVLEGIDVKR